MTKSNGIKSLKQAAKLLNKHAPDGESLAYINPEEARVLKARGGSGIMTLAGVPSYGLWDTITSIGKKALEYAPKVLDFFGSPAEAATPPYFPNYGSPGQMNPYFNIDDRSPNINYDYPPYPPSVYPDAIMRGQTGASGGGGGGSGNFLKDLATGAWTGIKERYSDPKNIAGDLGKAWLTVESYKGQKDLNKFEQDKYDRALADIAAGEAEFASNIGAAPLEITNMPTETDIASFTDVTLPSMKTTAVAQGGRIGYDNGDIVEKTFSEGVPQQFPSDALGAINVNEEQMAVISDMNNKGMDTSLISTISGVDEDTVIRYIRTLNAQAEGGRIGFNKGSKKKRNLMELLSEMEANFPGIMAAGLGISSMGIPFLKDGGRIGYNMGGIDTPFQGIGALNPRRGYQNAGEVENFNWGGPDMIEWATAREKGMDADPLFASRIMKLEGEHERDVAEHEGAALFDKAWDLVNRGIAEDINHALQMLRGEIEPQLPIGAAHGGRIGYNRGLVVNPGGYSGEADYAAWLAQIHIYMANGMSEEDAIAQATDEFWPGKKGGGRIGAEKGGIMPLLDMGGMEKDYRQDGGFVPIGRKEKADDVPARLSKNEFVFTADAVRAAGGGDIDQGAQRMYNVMKNLEAGGQISQQSQGKR